MRKNGLQSVDREQKLSWKREIGKDGDGEEGERGGLVSRRPVRSLRFVSLGYTMRGGHASRPVLDRCG